MGGVEQKRFDGFLGISLQEFELCPDVLPYTTLILIMQPLPEIGQVRLH